MPPAYWDYPEDHWSRSLAMMTWYFHDAPSDLQALSTNGGDEDFITYVPPGGLFDTLVAQWFGEMVDDDDGKPPRWEERTSAFGCCCVDRYELKNGGVAFIGSHA